MTPSLEHAIQLPAAPPTDMPYCCARIAAQSAHLLRGLAWGQLRASRSPADLFQLLLDTDYAESLAKTVLDAGDVDAWDAALAAVFARRVEAVRHWVEAASPRYGYLVVGPWDIHHVRTLLRRALRQSDPALAIRAYVPLGRFTHEAFVEAAYAASVAEAIRRMAAAAGDLADDLREWLASWRDETPSLQQCDLFVDALHFGRQMECAEHALNHTDAEALRTATALEIDWANLRTCLRHLARHPSDAEIRLLYLPGGAVDGDRFAEWMRADAIEQVRCQTPRGPLATTLEQGLSAFAATHRASVFERIFDAQRLRALRTLARGHPVSIAAALYYLARARNEWINLRAIVRGVRYGLPPGQVQENVVDA